MVKRAIFTAIFYGALVGTLVGGIYGFSISARCDGWTCFGPCGGPGQCPGFGCVCVGYSTGVGRCVSE